MSDFNFLNICKEIDDITMVKAKREQCVRAPFAWPGGKSKSIKHILPYLPYRESYIEPFGGSGAVLLARQPSNLEVFNDRFAGVVAFYRCIRDPEKVNKLVDRLKDTIHSREEFLWCRDTWYNCIEDVERAARWYYLLSFSFGSICRNFGRSVTNDAQLPKKMARHILEFNIIHNRIKNCCIENQDWRNILLDFDHEEAVFYLDPPYLDSYSGTYKHEMKKQDHIDLLNRIMQMKGFVAISGYENELYDSYNWDEKYSWSVSVSIKPMAFTDENKKKPSLRDKAQETLWIKN